ncbi:MAG: hypothetical protein R6U00_07720, partial [Prochlorococcaceae cyanobacterium]
EIDWRRHGGVWTEYPADHPDRLRGHELLNVNEYPPINPFRHPSFTSLLPVRNADFVTLTGERVPSLWIHAPNEGRRVTVRSLPDHRVGPLLLEELNNGFWVCRASAWISTPPRSSSPINCLSTARSWFSPVA